MATLDAETLDALNALLEDTRASVEIELALVNGTTELREQETLDAMGGQEVLACCALRERLALAGATVTWRINGIVFHILGTERYDDRLRSFARHQAAICERTEALLAVVRDQETHRLLQDLYDGHVQSARWAEQRANEFAATRLLDFTAPKPARDATLRQAAENAPLEPVGQAPPIPESDLAGGRYEAADATIVGHDHLAPHPPPEPDGHDGFSARGEDAPPDDTRQSNRDGTPRQE